MLTACSAGDDITGGNNTADNSNTIDGYDKAELTPISLGISSPISTTTRSTGTVGGTTTETNKWNGQTLWLFMTYKQGQDETKYGKGVMPAVFYDADGKASTDIELFNNRMMTAPASTVTESVSLANGEGKAITCADGSINYYPMTGTFNFFGYHVDDAATETTQTTIGSNTVKVPKVKYRTSATGTPSTTASTSSTIITVPVTIDGSQDLMVGTTTANDPDIYTGGTYSESVKSKFYSAFAARKNVHPILTFNHALSRFTFQVVAGDRTSAGLAEYKDKTQKTDLEELKTTPAKVTAIQLMSGTTNELVVANPVGTVTGNFINNTWGTETLLSLKELNEGKTETQKLTATALQWVDATTTTDGTPVSVGEALMLPAGQSEYEGYVAVEQWVKSKTSTTEKLPDEADRVAGQTYSGYWTKVTHRFPFTVTIPDDGTAQPGTSYNVKIWVYGLTELKVYVTAAPEMWDQNKEDIEVNKDED